MARDYRLEELVPKGYPMRELARALELYLGELDTAIDDLRGAMGVKPGTFGVYKSIAASGQHIRPGHWVHVRHDGAVAYLATAVPDGDDCFYATGVCVATSEGGAVWTADLNTVRAYCLPNVSEDGQLWLSTTAGWAQDTPPDAGSGYIQQEVGQKRGLRGEDGLCTVKVDCQGWTRR